MSSFLGSSDLDSSDPKYSATVTGKINYGSFSNLFKDGDAAKQKKPLPTCSSCQAIMTLEGGYDGTKMCGVR